MLIEGGKRHIIASVGDDNALTVSELEVVTAESTGSPVVKLIRQCSEMSAHSSSITGIMLSAIIKNVLLRLEHDYVLQE